MLFTFRIFGPGRRRALLLAAMLPLLLAAAPNKPHGSADHKAQPLPMPPGYVLPTIARPSVNPTTGYRHGVSGLTFAGPKRIIQRINLDPTPGNVTRRWTDQLLTMIVGGNVPWRPAQRYQAYPTGMMGERSGTAVALLGDRLIIFNGSLQGRPDATLMSINQPGYTMRLDGDMLIVSKKRGRRWYFQMPDDGVSWRLAKLGDIRHPNHFTSLVYDAHGRLTAITLPNDKQVKFALDANGLPVEIACPFGQDTQIERDAQGRIITIQRFRQLTKSGQRIRIGHRDYKYDDASRMIEYKDSQYVKWRSDYDVSSPGSDGRGKRVFTNRIINPVDEGFRFQQVVIDSNGSRTITVGGGSRGTPITTAVQNYAFAQQATSPAGSSNASKSSKHRNHQRHSSIRAIHAHAAGLAGIAPADRGVWRYTLAYLPDASTASIPTKNKLTYDDHGRLIESTSGGAGGIRGGRTIHYAYSPQGDLVEARVKGEARPHKFETDGWGRIVKHELPDGSFIAWHFDSFGQIARITKATPLPKSRGNTLAKTEYRTDDTMLEHDRFGRLTAIRNQNGHDEQYVYDERGFLGLLKRAGDPTLQYQHDRVGRVVERRTEGGSRERFHYHADGSLAKHAVDPPQHERFTVSEYNPRGQLIAQTIQGFGRTQYEYDKIGRRIHIIHADSTDTIYTYDDLNRVITIRGSHQLPADITYDKDGNRHVTTPENTPVSGGLP